MFDFSDPAKGIGGLLDVATGLTETGLGIAAAIEKDPEKKKKLQAARIGVGMGHDVAGVVRDGGSGDAGKIMAHVDSAAHRGLGVAETVTGKDFGDMKKVKLAGVAGAIQKGADGGDAGKATMEALKAIHTDIATPTLGYAGKQTKRDLSAYGKLNPADVAAPFVDDNHALGAKTAGDFAGGLTGAIMKDTGHEAEGKLAEALIKTTGGLVGAGLEMGGLGELPKASKQKTEAKKEEAKAEKKADAEEAKEAKEAKAEEAKAETSAPAQPKAAASTSDEVHQAPDGGHDDDHAAPAASVSGLEARIAGLEKKYASLRRRYRKLKKESDASKHTSAMSLHAQWV
jgi:hypothetical protein